MQSRTIADALLSPTSDVVDPATKQVVKSMPEDFWFGLRNKTPFVFQVQCKAEYEDLMAAMLNFPRKPSPVVIQDRASAAQQAIEPGIQASILNLLKTASTHVMKAVNSKYSALTVIDTTPTVEPQDAYGLCHDTIENGVALNIGGNAGDAGLIPFWLCKYITEDGILTSNLLTLMGDDLKQKALFADTLTALGGQQLLDDINATVLDLKNRSMPDEVQGKVVLFPLGASAIKGDEYIAITPVPSAAMILRFTERFFAEASAQKAHNAAAKKTDLPPRQFNYPKNQDVNIVASNPANCGSVIQSISGTAKAFKATVGQLSIEDRLGKDGFVVRKLQSGRGSHLSISNSTLDYLGRQFQFGKVERVWETRLPDVLAGVVESLQNLRQRGLPGDMAADQARFKHSVERRYVLKLMEGDVGKRNLTPTDIHELAQHVCDMLQQAMIRRDKNLGMSMDRQALVYQSLFDLLR